MGIPWTRKKALVMLAILGIVGGFAWWQYKPFLAAYYVHGLSQSDEANLDGWVAGVVYLGEAAVPFLLDALENANGKPCVNVEFALVGLVQKWGTDDGRAHLLFEQVSASKAGVAALHLAGALMERAPRGTLLDRCRRLAVEGLGAAAAEQRVAAIELVLRPPLRQEHDVLARVVPLLKDSARQVRKTALLALGPARELVSDDDLLPLLHDPDDEVQEICELALRSRGLSETHITLARLIGDERPAARLQVLELLRDAGDLEPGVWLRRLCLDPAPAVRAAAVRAAVAQSHTDLRNCLSEMAQQDPSPTVRQLARHYLNRYQPVNE